MLQRTTTQWQKMLDYFAPAKEAEEEEEEEEENAESSEDKKNKQLVEQRREWEWERFQVKQETKFHIPTEYNLYHQWYWSPENHPEEPRFWLLRSGLPFPSYHCNPARNFPPRVTLIDGAKDPVEEIRAPRIRLAPDELDEKQHYLTAMEKRGEENKAPPTIRTLNLSYQNLGEDYQFQQLQTFLKINSGVRVLAVNDNFLTDLLGFDLPYLEELYIARNNILSFTHITAFPNLKRLSIEENFIANLEGLTVDRFPKLRKLTLKWNPISENRKYRRKVFKAHLKLKILDDIQLR